MCLFRALVNEAILIENAIVRFGLQRGRNVNALQHGFGAIA
jgi:hypothetical protein